MTSRPMRIEEKLAYLKGLYTNKKSGDYNYYAGPTTVDPRAKSDVILSTKDKVVRSNIMVSKIRTYETSNDKGNTFYIASED